MVDIRNYPEILDAINAIINSKGLAEVKIEPGKEVVVVEQKRQVIIKVSTK